MKTKVKYTDNCECMIDVEIPLDMVEQTIKEVYVDIKKQAKLPGFRPGNVPQDLLEKHFSHDAKEEAMKRLVPESYEKALTEHKIDVVGYPDITDVSMSDGKSLTFKVRVDVRPKVKVKKYKGLKLKGKKIEVTDQEVDETLKRVQDMNAEFEKITEDRPVKRGDFTICDVEVFIDGKAISKKHQNMWIEADKESSMLGLGENLIDLKAADKKEIEAELPENYPDKKYAKKKALFKVEIKEIKEKKLPALDDELAKKVHLESLDKLKSEIRMQIETKKKTDQDAAMRADIIKELLSDNKFSLPQAMLKRQFDVLVKNFEEELVSKGVDKKVLEEKKTEIEPMISDEAEKKVRLYFILDDVANKEDIKVEDSDITAKFEALSISFRQEPKKIREYYEKNDLMGGFIEKIREDKALDLIMKNADISLN